MFDGPECDFWDIRYHSRRFVVTAIRFLRPAALFIMAFMMSRAQAAALEPVTVRLDWLAGIYHAPIFLAKARGYYAQEGLDVTFHNGQGSISTLQIVGSGNETIGLANLSALTLARSAGVPVVAIGALMEKSPEAVVTLATSGIRTPKDLEGKRWGLVPGDEAQRLFIAFAAQNRINLSSIHKVTLSQAAGFSALLNGDVDFVCAWTIEDAPRIAAIKPIGKPMLFTDSGLNTLGTVLFVTDSTLAAKPDVLRRFMRATRRGAADLEKSPQAGVDALVNSQSVYDRAFLTSQMQLLPGYFRTSNSVNRPFGSIAPEDIQALLHIMRAYYALPMSITADKIYTDEFAR